MKKAKPGTYSLYGGSWDASLGVPRILCNLIQAGGKATDVYGKPITVSLFQLYRDFQTELWQEDDHHPWSDLMLKTILEERFTVVQGPKDSSKTRTMAKYALCDYFAFPRDTLVLMSSTDLRGLELRVWGDLKDLFMRAREVWPDAPGFPLDSMYGIFTDQLNESCSIRDMRRGIICIPCLESSDQWAGLVKYCGIKQKRRRLLGDEVQLMLPNYLTALANLNKNDFKGCFVGNPIAQGDPLDKLAEPVNGWDDLLELTTTTTWRNRMGGLTINFVGSDSPAIKEPGKYPYLVNQKDIDYIINYWGKDSAEYWCQAMGVRRVGVNLYKVITREMCKLFGAQDEVIWDTQTEIKKVYAVDAGYGGDRCIGGQVEFGKDINGKWVIRFSEPQVIPVRVYPASIPEELRKLPEDQIAEHVKADCERLNIPAAHVFHDATGRGSLGSAFARLWRHDTNPVEFGGAPTPRPVLSDLFIYDEKLRQKRLKRCDEHYSKRVSELWFSVRYVIEGRQARELPNDVIEELCCREWKRVRGDKIEVEKKEDAKLRIGRSPDKADWAAIAVEGCRRLGFQISKMTDQAPEAEQEANRYWQHSIRDRAKRLHSAYTLTYAS